MPQLRELETPRLNLAPLWRAVDGARIEQGVSLRQLATHLGITPSTLTRIRQGKRPDAEALAVLATWANVPIRELLAPDDPAHRPRLSTRSDVVSVPPRQHQRQMAGFLPD